MWVDMVFTYISLFLFPPGPDNISSLGATGGSQDLMTTNFVETSSLMNCYNSDMYGKGKIIIVM